MTTSDPPPAEIAEGLNRFLAAVDEQEIEITASERAAIEGAIIALRVVASKTRRT
ncbi:hypothetical protein [Gordonia alkanivorans]|uniref:hypothetical protein n=1 Tax=Gordonia alkanivorans TaxID=84096 RepID=UPI0024498DE0|nr:hypothetical protein [Gordonia alkanivorans]MDH3006251.1 hypothetical protein [Gordonia alkanivorans]MDH3014008.1 hypothetical protein [Gordonia alkanivorans]MDH3042685.1 hypothetical protein [Gordonia alkanivorans]